MYQKRKKNNNKRLKRRGAKLTSLLCLIGNSKF